jgi:hypothetical protein
MTEPVRAVTLAVVDPPHQIGGLEELIGIHV